LADKRDLDQYHAKAQQGSRHTYAQTTLSQRYANAEIRQGTIISQSFLNHLILKYIRSSKGTAGGFEYNPA
jgi:hypothetical protein